MKIKDMIIDISTMDKKNMYRAVDEIIDCMIALEETTIYRIVLQQFLLDILSELEKIDDQENYVYIINRLKEIN